MIYLLLSLHLLLGLQSSILDNQKTLPRVKLAISEKLDSVKTLFESKNVIFPPDKLFLRAFKAERILEVWSKNAETDTFTFITSYEFCASSGYSGPKRKQGDLQIPEGFYFITGFNPFSKFYLSLRINYPNDLDELLGDQDNPGGDIFIHGDCVTIGCIPITDDSIKELYITALFCTNNQKNIPVHIFPTIMTDEKLAALNQFFNNKHASFWNNLKTGYDYFENNHTLPQIHIDRELKIYLYNQMYD